MRRRGNLTWGRRVKYSHTWAFRGNITEKNLLLLVSASVGEMDFHYLARYQC